MNLIFTLRHFLKAGYYNGHRVHSPNIFNFFKYVIFSKEKFDYTLAENVYSQFRKNRDNITVTTFGAKGGKTKEVKISSLAKKSSSKGKYGRLLQRTANFLQPRKILELGTSLGVGTLYLSSGSPDSKIITIEGCTSIHNFARESFAVNNAQNIEAVNSGFDEVLDNLITENQDIDLVYIDGNHTYQATMDYYELFSRCLESGAVLLFDDINWSKGMSKAWREIVKDSKSTVTIETARMGIVFLNPKLTPKHYCTRF
ncbi:MAG: class I SAM-dependent methyltransferase [Bacteroidales bacterium]|nr:class I SAM-dependent methyltransferase [Bacteroidales bacterium]